jgi:outer membrane receptor protein involved in Fe transport
VKPFFALYIGIIFISLSFHTLAYGGHLREPETSASLSGQVTDARNGSALGYASVVLYNNDSVMVAGTITSENGTFSIDDLKPGMYFLEIRYTGFRPEVIRDIHIETVRSQKDLGKISLAPGPEILKVVQVNGEASPVTYHPDKQVINASQVPDGGTGTAISLLQNSPSVTVTNDNQVLLRGSTGFLLLIDGKLVALAPGDALQQIPSSQVDRIEIITSPSAKHDAEGGAGMIHVILKKTGLDNTSGMVNLRIGSYDKYNLDGGFRLKRAKTNWDFNAGWYNHKGYPQSTTERIFENENSDRTVIGDGRIFRIRDGAFLRSSFGWDPTTTTSFNVWGDLTWFGFSRNTGTLYQDYSPDTDSSLYSLSKDQFILNGLTGSYGLIFRKTLDTADHYLEASFYQVRWWGMNDNRIDRFRSDIQRSELEKNYGRSYDEDNKQGDIQTKIDYVKQWPGIRMESGIMVTIRPTVCDFKTLLLDPVTGVWNTDTLSTGKHTFEQTKQAGYVLLSGKITSVMVQGGIRAEHYFRDFTLPGSDYHNQFEKIYWFPSLHFSFALPHQGQVQAGFNRRINYPNDWSLTPNPFFSDGYTYQIGNPELQPELISNAEVNWQQYAGKHVFTATLYYRYHQGQITRTVDLSKPPLMWMGYANMHHGTFTGIELSGNLRILDNLSLNSSLDLYQQKTIPALDSTGSQMTINTFQIRSVLNYTLRKTTRLQASLQYFGPEQEGTSTRLAMYSINLSARHDFPGKKLSASIQFSDILNTMNYRFTYRSDSGSSIVTWCPEYPLVSLAITYLFNGYRQESLPPADQDGGRGFAL